MREIIPSEKELMEFESQRAWYNEEDTKLEVTPFALSKPDFLRMAAQKGEIIGREGVDPVGGVVEFLMLAVPFSVLLLVTFFVL